jgi:hypothetical protein
MASIKKVIEVEVISNTGDIQKLSGSLEDVKKQVADISKAANNSVKFKMDGVDKTADDIANLSVQIDKADESTKELTNDTKNLKQQYREAVVELNSFEQGTEAYNVAAARAGALKDQLEENARAVNANKSGADALIGGLQGAAGAFAVAQGAAALFGKENEDIQKALLKVQSALAIVNGIEAFKDSIPNFTKLGQLVQGLPSGIGKLAAQLGLLGKAQKVAALEAKVLAANTQQAAASEVALGVGGVTAGAGVAGGMTAASAATNAFKATLISTGIGAIIVLLGTAAAYFASSFKSANEEASEAAEASGKQIEAQQGKVRAEYEKTKARLDDIDLTGGSKKASYDQLITDQKAYLDEAVKAEVNANDAVILAAIALQESIDDEDEDDIEANQLKLTELETARNEANAKTIQAQTAVNQAIIDKDKNLFKESNKGLQDQINKKKAAGQSTLALQIEYKQKELEATKKFNVQQTEEEEKLNNEIIALQKSLADEQRAAYEKAQSAKKANQQAIASLDIATLENQKATALAAAKNDQEKLDIETKYFELTKKVRIDSINTQAALDKSLVKSSETSTKEKNTIEKNRLTALKAIETETVNIKEKSEETQKKINLDALNEEAAILQEKTKLEDASFQDRINLVLKQQQVELATLEVGGAKYKAVVNRQAEELIKLRKELADKIASEANKKLVEAQEIGDLDQEIKDSQKLIDLKQNEGETLVEFQKRRSDLEKELSAKRLKDQNVDLQAQLDQTITYTEDGVEKTRKAVEEGSKEELAIKKKMNDNSEELYQEDAANKLAAEEEKKAGIEKLINDTMALLGEAAAFAQAMLAIETKRIEEEYQKRADNEQNNLDKRLDNVELTESQIAELQRQSAIEQTKIEEEKQAQIKEVKKKQADIDLAITISEILASTALAFIRGFSDLGPIGGTVFAAIFAVTSAAQIATAIAQRQAIQGLARGGMVYGMGGPTDDMIPIMASNGEAVINARAVTKFAPVLSAINESTGGAPIRPRFAAGGIITTNPGEVSVSNIQDIAAITGQNAVRAYILESDVTSQSIKNQRITRNARIK